MNISNTRPYQTDEINKELEIDLDMVVRRLEVIVGSDKQVDIVRWLGVNLSSMNNWKRRGTVPYKAIVEALLAKGISLDSFFAPNNTLKTPEALLLHETLDYGVQSLEKQKQNERKRIIQASQASSAFLRVHGIEESELTLDFCIDFWLFDDGALMSNKAFQSIIVNQLKRFHSITSEV